jgi:ubiquinone/menaquinone biosynthesis C-methylase UbiE
MPYEMLARVYDRWTANNDYAKWASFIAGWLSGEGRNPQRLLDVCCGTGRVSELLQRLGHEVTGIDRSPEMLGHACERLGAETELICGDVRDSLVPAETFDGAFSTFDSLNYLTEDGGLQLALLSMARAVAPGGVVIFDVNSQYKMERVHGDSHYGDDLDGFAYVWRNRHNPESRRTKFLITVFEKESDGRYVRFFEQHEQRWFRHEEIRAATEAAGLSLLAVHDDYTDAPLSDATLRETWVFRRS